MVEMVFHWEREATGETGRVFMSSSSVDECIETAEGELESSGLLITDYYVI